jgi:serine/threonine protein phosphatase PrpC
MSILFVCLALSMPLMPMSRPVVIDTAEKIQITSAKQADILAALLTQLNKVKSFSDESRTIQEVKKLFVQLAPEYQKALQSSYNVYLKSYQEVQEQPTLNKEAQKYLASARTLFIKDMTKIQHELLAANKSMSIRLINRLSTFVHEYKNALMAMTGILAVGTGMYYTYLYGVDDGSSPAKQKYITRKMIRQDPLKSDLPRVHQPAPDALKPVLTPDEQNQPKLYKLYESYTNRVDQDLPFFRPSVQIPQEEARKYFKEHLDEIFRDLPAEEREHREKDLLEKKITGDISLNVVDNIIRDVYKEYESEKVAGGQQVSPPPTLITSAPVGSSSTSTTDQSTNTVQETVTIPDTWDTVGRELKNDCELMLKDMKVLELSVQSLSTDKILCGLSERGGDRTIRLKKDHSNKFTGQVNEWALAMEDRCAVHDFGNNNYFFAVYDGHGGVNAADTASKKLHLNYGESHNIQDAFNKTHEEIIQVATDGTTAVAAIIENNRLQLVWAGDSRAVLAKDGKIAFATTDHKPDTERKAIESRGGLVYAGRIGGLAVGRSLGDKQVAQWTSHEPDIKEFNLDDGYDFVILACDGVWDVLSNEDAVNLVNRVLTSPLDQIQSQYPTNPSKRFPKSNPPSGFDRGGFYFGPTKIIQETVITEAGNDEKAQLAARVIRDEAYNKGSKDNISVLVIIFKKTGTAESTSERSKVEQSNTTKQVSTSTTSITQPQPATPVGTQMSGIWWQDIWEKEPELGKDEKWLYDTDALKKLVQLSNQAIIDKLQQIILHASNDPFVVKILIENIFFTSGGGMSNERAPEFIRLGKEKLPGYFLSFQNQ